MVSASWVVIGNPENRRVNLFVQALTARLGVTPVVISYLELLQSDDVRVKIAEAVGVINNGAINIKIESPGENFDVTKALLTRGAILDGRRLKPSQVKSLLFDKGRFKFLKEWFLGYRQLLGEIDTAFEQLSQQFQVSLSYLNSPVDIVTMLDKQQCQQFLSMQHVNVPALLPIAKDLPSLLDQLIAAKSYSVFIKPRYGSSAAGVIALRIKPDGSQCIARTSLELTQSHGIVRCYNSLKVRTYRTLSDIAQLYSEVIEEDAYVERWLPKPQLQGKNFDLRVVVINGKTTHSVTRCSHSPMTNLHLGNQRGDLSAHPQGELINHQAQMCAETVAALMPGSRCIGADVIVTSAASNAYIVELNAFGDLLPGVEYQGLSTYEHQVNVCW